MAALVTTKFHSGRETDFRNVFKLMEGADLDAVTPHLRRGNADAFGSSWSVAWKSWKATNSSTDIGLTSGAQLSQKKRSPHFGGICFRRLIT